MNHVITDTALRMLLNGQTARLSRGVCSTEEAMYILGIGRSTFLKEANSRETKLRPSKKKGKWIMSSVKREFERIHGYKYSEAIEE